MMSDSANIIIFGITGDLSQRYLLPGLMQMASQGRLGKNTKIIGVSRRNVSAEDLFNQFKQNLEELGKDVSETDLKSLSSITTMLTVDLNDSSSYQQINEQLEILEMQSGVCLDRLFYLSVPPQVYPSIVDNLGRSGLSGGCQKHNKLSKLLVEKPFGYDLKSASKLLDQTNAVFSEEQIFRIDHFLAKKGVQEFLNLRKTFNQQLEPYWSDQHIEEIEICASEEIDIEGRAKFYEPLGALRDFVQNHLMQVLGLTGMDIQEKDVINAKSRFLKSLKPVNADDDTAAVRGQYLGYLDEVGNPDSATETYAAISLKSDLPKWTKTRFYLWSGKALRQKTYAIKVKFVDHSVLVFHLQPLGKIESEGEDLSIASKLVSTMEEYNSHLGAGDEASQSNAYEDVIRRAIASDHSIFASREDVLESWRVVEPVIKKWTGTKNGLIIYQKGTNGPLNRV